MNILLYLSEIVQAPSPASVNVLIMGFMQGWVFAVQNLFLPAKMKKTG